MITVLMPAHKYHQWLESAIDSVLNSQTKYDFELLVLANNMNRFDLDKLICFSKTRNFRLLNLGSKTLSESLNEGLFESNFEFIARLDSDDFMEPNRLQVQADFLKDNPSISLVASKVTLINEKGQVIGGRTPPSGHRGISCSLRFGNCLVHPSVMFRRTEILRVGGYEDTYPHAEDYDLYMRLVDTNKFDAIPESLTNYRIFADQISSQNSSVQLKSSIDILSCYFNNKSLASRFKSKLYKATMKLRYERFKFHKGTFRLVALLVLNFVISPIVTYQFLKNSFKNLR